MTLMDYCMQYIGEIMDGKRAAPEGVTLTETDHAPQPGADAEGR